MRVHACLSLCKVFVVVCARASASVCVRLCFRSGLCMHVRLSVRLRFRCGVCVRVCLCEVMFSSRSACLRVCLSVWGLSFRCGLCAYDSIVHANSL